jgi:lysophospholipase L1-like esterase
MTANIDISAPGSYEVRLRSNFLNLSSRPSIRRIACLGDSRVASMFTDPSNSPPRYKTENSQINQMIALSGRRVQLAYFGGVSGDRTDQIMARTSLAIASGAGVFYILGGVNDIAQNYPSAMRSGAVAAANIIAMARAFVAAGGEVIVETEIGSENFTSAQISQMLELNQRLRDFSASQAHVHLHAATYAVMDADSSTSAIAFNASYSMDGTHLTPRAAYYWGKSLAALLSSIVPPAYHGQVSRFETAANGRLQLLANPIFAAATGGTPGSGNTGSLPSSISVIALALQRQRFL